MRDTGLRVQHRTTALLRIPRSTRCLNSNASDRSSAGSYVRFWPKPASPLTGKATEKADIRVRLMPGSRRSDSNARRAQRPGPSDPCERADLARNADPELAIKWDEPDQLRPT